jgi:hypothetical protein
MTKTLSSDQWLLVALLALPLMSKEAYAEDCSNFADKSVSISVGFTYKGTHLDPLPESQNGARFHYQQATNFTDNRAQLGSEDAPDKPTFLKTLTEKTKSATYVNLSYDGHGEVINGVWEMILPSMPEIYLMDGCLQDVMAKEPVCAGAYRYLVSDSELRNALGPNKKIFATFDSCHSGGINLGPNSTVLAASASDQSAYHQSHSNYGALTNAIVKLSNQCNVDKNGDGKISASELLDQFSQMPPNSSHQSRTFTFQNLKELQQGKILDLPQHFRGEQITTAGDNFDGGNTTGEQRPGIIGNANAPWLNCMTLSKPVNTGCGRAPNTNDSSPDSVTNAIK